MSDLEYVFLGGGYEGVIPLQMIQSAYSKPNWQGEQMFGVIETERRKVVF